jgi:hypothetical protein
MQRHRQLRIVASYFNRVEEIKLYLKSSFPLVISDAAAAEISVSEREARPLSQRLPGL